MATKFAMAVEKIEKTARKTERKVDETYRPVFDAAAKLDAETALTVTFDDEKTADDAKGTVQTLANEAGYTVRERRGTRVVHEDGTCTISLVKRPRQRAPKPAAQTDAAAE